MRSQGEIEAAVCEGLTRFNQEFIGRGPQDIHAHLVGSLLLVRMTGALTAAERQLLRPRENSHQHEGDVGNGAENLPIQGGGNGKAEDHSSEGANGRSLLKQVRSHVVATGRPRLEEIVAQAAGVRLVSVHHDISTVTGEEVLVFSLETAPMCRPRKRSPC
ncbi:MAG: DUF2294 domain-containing protein [Planctomycetaceae bacterium]